jgi:acetylornithine deacetylase
METDLKQPLVRQFLTRVGQTGRSGAHYFCDAAVLSGGGVPSVVFGPGDIAQAHTADEWISLRDLDKATRMLFSFLQALP